MKKLKYILIVLALITTVLSVVFVISYKNGIKAVDINDKREVLVTIPQGSTTNTIMKILLEKELISSELNFKIYLKLNKVGVFKASTYKLSKSMSLEEILDVLQKGNSFNPDEIKLTFIEGLTIKRYASVIAKFTNNTEKDVFDLLNDEKYQNELISKYWYITDDIKAPRIYYSLEGYLFPDTYIFRNKDVSVKEIFDKMLKQTENKLKPYKSKIQNNKLNIHEILTLASMIELEGSNKENKKVIAGVFYNRIKKNDFLGSDVTAYYGQGLEMKDHLKANHYKVDDYNTRVIKGYPASPICSPSIDAIEAAINPAETDYYFFVADKNRKIYFTKTLKEHNSIIQELMDKGLWLA